MPTTVAKQIPDESIVVYKSSDGKVSFEVNVFEESIWLTQLQMSALFEKAVPTINEHIKNCFEEGELDKKSVIRKFRITASDGKQYDTNHYSLDLIISVGYRVKSKRGTQFRIWATQILKEYLLNGYSLNSRRLMNIEKSIDTLIKNDNSQQSKIAALEEHQRFVNQLVVKSLEKKSININNYIETKSTVNSNINISLDYRRVQNQLEDSLKKAVSRLSQHKNLQAHVENNRKDVSNISKDEKTKQRFFRFISDLGDSDSSIYKLMTGAGVAKELIKKIVKLGLSVLSWI